jgi:hypothetical protein
MLIIILKIILLLGVIIIPLRPQKRKRKINRICRNNTSTIEATYAINPDGDLEQMQRTSPADKH